jgi:phosphoglycerate dehydrogenase-like enzyme
MHKLADKLPGLQNTKISTRRSKEDLISMTLNVLVSEQMATHYTRDITAVLEAVPHRIWTPERARAEATEPGIDIAFISREVTGKSSYSEPTPALAEFYRHLRRSPQLKWVQGHAAGADRPIYPELLARGVRVSTASGASAPIVCEHALAGLLSLSRHFPKLAEQQRQHLWNPMLGDQVPPALVGTHAVVVGFGPIGRRLSRLLGALELRVTVVRREASAAPGDPATIGYAQLDSVLPQTDWLILACPVTPLTRGLIDARRLALLPAHAHLLNVARGEVVVEADLIAALQRKALAGAFLDVFETEPLTPDSPLWDLPNVMISPHSAAQSGGMFDAVARIWLDNLARWQSGAPLLNEVSAEL